MTRKDVIRRILERERTNQSLTDAVVQKDAAELYQAGCELFGLWGIALQYAGVSPPIELTRDAVIRAIRGRQRELKCLASSHIQCQFPSLYAAAIEHLKSWDAALLASGINPKNVHRFPRGKKPSRQQVIDAIVERNNHGLSMRRYDVSCENYSLACLARDHFGSWSKACVVAGIVMQPTQE